MLYVVVQTVTGAQNRAGVEPLEAGVGETLLTFAGLNADPSSDSHEWSRDLLAYVPRPGYESGPIARTKLTVLEFIRRLSQEENAALNYMRLNPATPLATRAQLETLKEYRDNASSIDLEDADTVAGAGVAVDVLIASGLVLLADRSTRIAAVLAPATTN